MNTTEYTVLGEIDPRLLKGEFGYLKTKIVIVTNERLTHIVRQHPQDVKFFQEYASTVLKSPDLIIKDLKNPNTIFMIKSLQETNLNVMLSLGLQSTVMAIIFKIP